MTITILNAVRAMDDDLLLSSIVLDEARGRTKEQVLAIVARLRPRPDVPATIRKLSQPQPPSAPGIGISGANVAASALPLVGVAMGAATPASPRPPVAPPLPLSPDRYKYALTIDGETKELLAAVKDLSRLDDATILKRALALLRKKIEREKFGLTEHPRSATPAVDPESRYIPSAVRRDVATRDNLRCAFVSATGRRCDARAHLEFDHVKPYAQGGGKDPTNLRVLCKAHNSYEARRHFDIPEREAEPNSFWNG
jgi:hypothetical protein